MPAYHPTHVGDGHAVICQDCGALVANTKGWQDLHDDHHERLDRISQEASRYKSPPVYG